MFRVLSVLTILSLLSCKANTFKPNQASEKSPKKSADATKTKVCEKENTLKAVLLSQSLSQSPINESLIYRLELTSCDKNKPISFKNELIYFDIDATGLYLTDLKFLLKDLDSLETIYEGTLKSIQGSDLFGKSGSFSHNRSKSLNLDLDTSVVIIEIFLQGKPINSLDGSDRIKSYLRVGSSAAASPVIPLTP